MSEGLYLVYNIAIECNKEKKIVWYLDIAIAMSCIIHQHSPKNNSDMKYSELHEKRKLHIF